jgi:hypothetical protein
MVAECPSLNPKFESFQWRSPQAAAAAGEGAALAAALGGSTVLSTAQLERLKSVGSRSSNGNGVCNRQPQSPGLGSALSYEAVWDRINGVDLASAQQQQQQQEEQGCGELCRGLQVQLSLSAPLRSSRSTSIEEYTEQLQGRQHEKQPGSSAAEAAVAAGLSKAHETGRSGALEQVMDDVVEQLQQQQGAAAAARQVFGAAYSTPVRRHADVDSHYLPDQGSLTSPWTGRATDAAAAAACLPACASPLSSPEHLPAISATNAATPQPSPMLKGAPRSMAAAEADGCMSPWAAAESGPRTPAAIPSPSPRILRPMMSMRLTCQPRWIASNSDDGNKGQRLQQHQLPTSAAAERHERPSAVHLVHQDRDQQDWQVLQQGFGAAACDRQAIAGLWPTTSWSLVPVGMKSSSVAPGRA